MNEPTKVSIFTPNNPKKVFHGRRRKIIFSIVFFLFKSKWQELKQKFSEEHKIKISAAVKNFFQNITRIKNASIKKEVFESVINIVLAIELIIGGYLWMQHNSIILAAHSEENSGILEGSYEISPSKDTASKEKTKLDLADQKVSNKYVSQLKETKCDEDKDQKKSSNFCGKDDEEEIQKIIKEEKRKAAQVVVKKAAPVKISCPHPEQKPQKSKTKGKHMDEDCCPDPDEWPKPGCIYDAKGYAIMLPGPPKKK